MPANADTGKNWLKDREGAGEPATLAPGATPAVEVGPAGDGAACCGAAAAAGALFVSVPALWDEA